VNNLITTEQLLSVLFSNKKRLAYIFQRSLLQPHSVTNLIYERGNIPSVGLPRVQKNQQEYDLENNTYWGARD
jgi:hypothetical protein